MNSPGWDHEEALVRDIQEGRPVSLERALLVLSGLRREEEILSYQEKIDDIFSRFVRKCDRIIGIHPSGTPSYLHRSIAQCLFEYFWNSKPRRFGEYFLLADVVDAQLDPDVHRPVGTCVGLTSLYSVIGVRAGLQLSLLVSSDHLLSRLRVGPQAIDMDHTDPQGFGAGSADGFREAALLTLTANVLNSRGLRSEAGGRFPAAWRDYDQAVTVDPEYANAYNNRGNMRFRAGDLEGAVADYTEALRLNPRFCEAYCHRGMARHRLGHHDAARRDYRAALGLNADYGDARRCLQLLDEHG
jgi:tetratricopeptide (TPR) repeat protein